jgi:hypothetical protein
MKKSFIILLTVLVTVLFIGPAHSQMKKLGQTGLQFLKLDVSPREAAMGGAYTMAGQDATAMFSNPSGMALSQTSADIFIGRINWFADIAYNALAIMKSFDEWGTFGVSFMNADYGQIIGTRVADTEKGYEETGDVGVDAYVVGLSYARALTNKFTIGAQVKYTYQHLGGNRFPDGSWVNNEVDGFAFDFGTIFYPGWKSFGFGVAITNFSSDYKYQEENFSLPLTFKVGVMMDMLDFMGEHQNPLLLAIDAVHPRDYTERIHLGLEYVYMNIFSLRGGYKFNYDEEGVTAGLGVQYTFSDITGKLDYAYGDFGVFDAVHRFSFGIGF